ncbi:hypothetical protein RQP46_003339 [Phenoliferia psychrophenolica]
MSQVPVPVAARATFTSIASLAPKTLAQILTFAAYKREKDFDLQVLHDNVCLETLESISLVCKLWRDVVAPLNFQTPQLIFNPFKPNQNLLPFQLNPSLANDVRALRLSLGRGSFKFWDGERIGREDGEGEADPGPQVEDWHPLTEWMLTLKKLCYLRLDLFQINRDSYAEWPVDAFPNVTALQVVSVCDWLFCQALITRMPKLDSLYLSSNGNLGFNSPAQHLVGIDALPNSRCLTKLILFKCDVSPATFRQLAATSGSTLEMLEVFRAYSLEDDDLAHALVVAPGIKRLRWNNEQTDPGNNNILPLSPSLLRALSTSHLTNLNIHPWPTPDLLDALPSTLIKLNLGNTQSYPGHRYCWGRGNQRQQVLEDTFTAILDARVAGRFPNMNLMQDMLREFGDLDAVFLERAEQEGLTLGRW